MKWMQLGLDAYGVASNPRQYAGQSSRELREALARVKDFLYVIIKPEPTYLGESIPVSGNGYITNDISTIPSQQVPLFADAYIALTAIKELWNQTIPYHLVRSIHFSNEPFLT